MGGGLTPLDSENGEREAVGSDFAVLLRVSGVSAP